MKSKYIILFMCTLIIYFLASTSSIAEARENEIIVGVDVNVPPMGFMSESGEIIGVDIDLAKELFKNMNKPVKFQPIDWDAKELELETGNIDVIWNGLSRTPERENSMSLTRPYMKNRQVVIVKNGSSINKVDELQNKNVCVQKGSTGLDALKKHEISKRLGGVTELENMTSCMNEVKSGISDATIVDEVVARYYLSKENLKDEFKVLDEEISSEYYVVAVKKGNDSLKKQIEEGLNFLNKSGRASEVSQKWFSKNIFFWEQPKAENISADAQNLGQLLFLLRGLAVTLRLFFIVILVSIPCGFMLCVIKNLKNKFLNFLINTYINLMRGTPLLLQLFFLFYGLPYIPIIGSYFTLRDRFLAASVAFILNYTAYFAEIFRGGFLSIDRGQIEAARVLGISRVQTFYRVLIPQLLKVTLPTICNEAITLVKDTSLVYALRIQDILSNAKSMVNATANVSAYVLSAAIYLLICYLLIKIFRRFEKRLSF